MTVMLHRPCAETWPSAVRPPGQAPVCGLAGWPGLGIWRLLATAVLAGAGAAAAADRSADDPPAEAALPAALETTRHQTRAASEWLARHVDSWFGDKPFDDGGRVTDGRLSLGFFKRSDRSQDIDLRFNAQFILPNAQRFGYLFIGRDNPRNVIQDTPDALSRRQQLLASRPTERSFLAGLGMSLPRDVDLRLGVGARLKPYLQARYHRPWTLAPGHRLEFRETLFLTAADRLGSTTVLTYDYDVSPTLALRWLNAATITQMTRNFEWSSSLGVHRAFGLQRLASLELLVSGTGTQGTGVGMSDYGVLARWEQPVYKHWLLGEVVAGHFWPRPDAHSQRGRAWAFGASLKMHF